MKNMYKSFILSVVLVLTLPLLAAGQDTPVSIAVLAFDNMNGNPDQDYLKGIISYILIEDLSSSDQVMVVDRENINDVIKEQNLQLTGIMDDSVAIETGKLLGASFMLKGSYVFLGQDVFINISLIDVETGSSRTFSQRGYQENTVHALGEKILKFLTGEASSLVNSGGEKSILALEQQEPGEVKLFSYIIDARIYVDDEFIGYTTGDHTKPFKMKLTPGKHTVRIHLTKDFGVIELPEISFHDWQEQINLLPGESIVLEDRTRHFNDLLYDIKQLLRKSLKVNLGSGEQKERETPIEFIDRDGNKIKILLSIRFRETDSPRHGGSAEVTLRYQDKEYSYNYFAPHGKDLDFSREISKIRLDIGLDCNSTYKYELDYSVWRTDVWQGMHRE